MLQEVLSTSVLESLMLHLADEFDCSYLPCRPRMPSIMLWTFFLLVMGCVQSLFLQPVLAVWSGNLSWIRWLLLSICMSLNLALRWRHSIPAHFLFGNIAGQLVVLRRKTLGCQEWWLGKLAKRCHTMSSLRIGEGFMTRTEHISCHAFSLIFVPVLWPFVGPVSRV